MILELIVNAPALEKPTIMQCRVPESHPIVVPIKHKGEEDKPSNDKS